MTVYLVKSFLTIVWVIYCVITLPVWAENQNINDLLTVEKIALDKLKVEIKKQTSALSKMGKKKYSILKKQRLLDDQLKMRERELKIYDWNLKINKNMVKDLVKNKVKRHERYYVTNKTLIMSTENFIRKKINYSELNDKQKESYNFQKVSAILADYGYVTIRLSDDWNGADFIAQHHSGSFIKVQLKSRITFDKKYKGKDIFICFPNNGDWYLYPHDEALALYESNRFANSDSWKKKGIYHWSRLSKEQKPELKKYIL